MTIEYISLIVSCIVLIFVIRVYIWLYKKWKGLNAQIKGVGEKASFTNIGHSGFPRHVLDKGRIRDSRPQSKTSYYSRPQSDTGDYYPFSSSYDSGYTSSSDFSCSSDSGGCSSGD